MEGGEAAAGMGWAGVPGVGGGKGKRKSLSALEAGRSPPAQAHPPASENTDLSHVEAGSQFPIPGPGPGTGISLSLAATTPEMFTTPIATIDFKQEQGYLLQGLDRQ